MYNLRLNQNLFKHIYITIFVVTVFFAGTSAYFIVNMLPTRMVQNMGYTKASHTQTKESIVLRKANTNVPSNDAALTIVKDIRSYRNMDDATAGKLHSKTVDAIDERRLHGELEISFNQVNIDDLMLNAYVYPEERDYWTSYFYSLGY